MLELLNCHEYYFSQEENHWDYFFFLILVDSCWRLQFIIHQVNYYWFFQLLPEVSSRHPMYATNCSVRECSSLDWTEQSIARKQKTKKYILVYKRVRFVREIARIRNC